MDLCPRAVVAQPQLAAGGNARIRAPGVVEGVLLAAAMALPSCGTEQPPPVEDGVALLAVPFSKLPGWPGDALDGAALALKRACSIKAGRRYAAAPYRLRRAGSRAGDDASWRRPCAELRSTATQSPAALRRFFESRFTPYRISHDGDDGVVFTGYFEPLLYGARRKSERYHTPLYGVPHDLVRLDLARFGLPPTQNETLWGRVEEGEFVPYPTRGEIMDGALAGRGLALFWVDDAVDAFFLAVQGSGRLRLEGGGTARVGYGARNGHPYRSIGAWLIEQGALAPEAASAQDIKRHLREHPEQLRDVLAHNPSFIFFRAVTAADDDGPIGASGASLTAGHSIAVDRRFFALGSLMWIETRHPVSGEKLQRLTVAQDTGSAIKGPLRADFFWGHGRDAERAAGRMKHEGRYFLLLPTSGITTSRAEDTAPP